MTTAPRARTYRTIIATMLAVVVLSTICWAAEFSSDFIQKVGKQSINGKIYIKGVKIRQDITMQKLQMATIIRGDKKLVWMLQPTQKSYMEVDLRSMPGGADIGKSLQLDSIVKSMGGKAAVTQKFLGRETVNGYPCDRYSITPRTTRQGRPAGTMTLWVSKKFGMPLRLQTSGATGMQMEIKNIREGRVADALFELPKGYKKMTMPKMSGGMGRGPVMGGRGGPMPR